MVVAFRPWHRLLLPAVLVAGVAAAVVWQRAGSPVDPHIFDSGDRVRDAVVRAFDQRVLAAGDRQPPFGQTVRIQFSPSEIPVPAPLRHLVEDIAAATHGRVGTDASASGEIAVVMGKGEDGPCRIRREVWMGGAVRGAIVVDAGSGAEAAQRCFADTLLAMLGLPRGGDAAAVGLSPRERVLLPLLFSADLAPGMGRGQVLAAVRRQVEALPVEALCAQPGGFC